MIVIADCGSSKTDWAVVDAAGNSKRFVTRGANPAVMQPDELRKALAEVTPHLEGVEADKLWFYGAGCLPEICGSTATLLAEITGIGEVEVESDLLGAARALFGRSAGIACILGTGSNSCFYDGRKIVDHVSPLGYILGDEGSGAVLGKLLVGDVLKHQLPRELCEQFLREYDLDSAEIIRRVYRTPAPNRFLASLAPFLAEHIDEPAVHRLVLNAFKAFMVRNVANYPYYRTLPLAFCGSIAAHFADTLAEAAAAMDCRIQSIEPSPMPGLIAYHTA